MFFHYLTDFIDICLRLVIFQLHVFQFVGTLFEEAKKALFLLLVKIFQLAYHAGEHLSDFAHILSADVIQSTFRKIGDFFLAARAVLHDKLGIGDINLGSKVVYHFLFLRGQNHLGNFRSFLGRRKRVGFIFFRLGKGLKGKERGFRYHFV